MNENPSEAAVLAWARLMKAGQAALAGIERDLKGAGFPPLEWYDVLLELRREAEGVRPVELESRLLLKQHNVSRLVDRLEAAGLAERRRCARDGRGQFVAITDAGRRLLADMWPVYRMAIQRHVGSRIECGEAEELARILAKLFRAPDTAAAVPGPTAEHAV